VIRAELADVRAKLDALAAKVKGLTP